MSLEQADDEREVVPRWRTFAETAKAGSLDALSGSQALAADLSALEYEYDQIGGVYIASDFLSAMVAAGATHPRLEEVATGLLATPDLSQALQKFAEESLSPKEAEVALAPQTFQEKALQIRRVGHLRRRLRQNPANAIIRTDLALAQLTNGHHAAARRQISTALQLAPDNRFVLRAAARFNISMAEPDKAVVILRQSARTRSDPWLLSSLLASAQLAGQPIPLHRDARELLAAEGSSDRSLSELASELGTLEVHAGRDKRARALFGQSLADPNENTVAQAEWASNNVGLVLPTGLLDVDRGYEARSRAFARVGSWASATSEGILWLRDEPFAIEPALNTSYAAAFGLEKYDMALKVSEIALRVHPNDAALRNNAAYAAANLGDLARAKSLTRGVSEFNDENEFSTFRATLGLIAYREGRIDEGRRLYREAIDGFSSDSSNLIAVAACLWALEEVRARTPIAADVTRAALAAASKVDHVDVQLVESRLRQLSGLAEH